MNLLVFKDETGNHFELISSALKDSLLIIFGTFLSSIDIFSQYLEAFPDAKKFYIFASISLGLFIIFIFMKSKEKIISVLFGLTFLFSLYLMIHFGQNVYDTLSGIRDSPMRFLLSSLCYSLIVLIIFYLFNIIIKSVSKKFEPRDFKEWRSFLRCHIDNLIQALSNLTK